MSFTVDKTTNSKAIPTLKVPEASSANAIAKTRETGQQFSNLVRKEQKGAVNPEQQALTSVVDETRQVLEPLAKDKDAFNAVLKQAFGDDFDAGKAETLRQQILAGDYSWAPKVELVDSKQLGDTSGTQTSGRALGAYAESTDTIYLDRELVASDPKQAKAVLLEEMGHAIDARINSTDAKGDEGAIFAKLASGEKISAEKMQALKSENDKGILKIDGKEIEVEYRFLPSFFPRRKKSFGLPSRFSPRRKYFGIPSSSPSRTRVRSTPQKPKFTSIRATEAASAKARSTKPKGTSVAPKPPLKSQGIKTYTDNGHAATEADNPFSRVNPNNPTELMYGPFKPSYQPAVSKPATVPSVSATPQVTNNRSSSPLLPASTPATRNGRTPTANLMQATLYPNRYTYNPVAASQYSPLYSPQPEKPNINFCVPDKKVTVDDSVVYTTHDGTPQHRMTLEVGGETIVLDRKHAHNLRTHVDVDEITIQQEPVLAPVAPFKPNSNPDQSEVVLQTSIKIGDETITLSVAESRSVNNGNLQPIVEKLYVPGELETKDPATYEMVEELLGPEAADPDLDSLTPVDRRLYEEDIMSYTALRYSGVEDIRIEETQHAPAQPVFGPSASSTPSVFSPVPSNNPWLWNSPLSSPWLGSTTPNSSIPPYVAKPPAKTAATTEIQITHGDNNEPITLDDETVKQIFEERKESEVDDSVTDTEMMAVIETLLPADELRSDETFTQALGESFEKREVYTKEKMEQQLSVGDKEGAVQTLVDSGQYVFGESERLWATVGAPLLITEGDPVDGKIPEELGADGLPMHEIDDNPGVINGELPTFEMYMQEFQQHHADTMAEDLEEEAMSKVNDPTVLDTTTYALHERWGTDAGGGEGASSVEKQIASQGGPLTALLQQQDIRMESTADGEIAVSQNGRKVSLNAAQRQAYEEQGVAGLAWALVADPTNLEQRALITAMPEVRKEMTEIGVEQAKTHSDSISCGSHDVEDRALKIYKANMDATLTADERSALEREVGDKHLGEDYVRETIQSIEENTLEGHEQTVADNVGFRMQRWAQIAPTEFANDAIKGVQAEYDDSWLAPKGTDTPVESIEFNRTNVNPYGADNPLSTELYGGFSALVELDPQMAEGVADWVVGQDHFLFHTYQSNDFNSYQSERHAAVIAAEKGNGTKLAVAISENDKVAGVDPDSVQSWSMAPNDFYDASSDQQLSDKESRFFMAASSFKEALPDAQEKEGELFVAMQNNMEFKSFQSNRGEYFDLFEESMSNADNVATSVEVNDEETLRSVVENSLGMNADPEVVDSIVGKILRENGGADSYTITSTPYIYESTERGRMIQSALFEIEFTKKTGRASSVTETVLIDGGAIERAVDENSGEAVSADANHEFSWKYDSLENFIDDNDLDPDGTIHLAERQGGEIVIKNRQAAEETFWERNSVWVDTAAGVVAVVGVVAAPFTAGQSLWLTAGATAYGAGRSFQELNDMASHGQNWKSLKNPRARAAWFELASLPLNFVGFGAGVKGVTKGAMTVRTIGRTANATDAALGVQQMAEQGHALTTNWDHMSSKEKGLSFMNFGLGASGFAAPVLTNSNAVQNLAQRYQSRSAGGPQSNQGLPSNEANLNLNQGDPGYTEALALSEDSVAPKPIETENSVNATVAAEPVVQPSPVQVKSPNPKQSNTDAITSTSPETAEPTIPTSKNQVQSDAPNLRVVGSESSKNSTGNQENMSVVSGSEKAVGRTPVSYNETMNTSQIQVLINAVGDDFAMMQVLVDSIMESNNASHKAWLRQHKGDLAFKAALAKWDAWQRVRPIEEVRTESLFVAMADETPEQVTFDPETGQITGMGDGDIDPDNLVYSAAKTTDGIKEHEARAQNQILIADDSQVHYPESYDKNMTDPEFEVLLKSTEDIDLQSAQQLIHSIDQSANPDHIRALDNFTKDVPINISLAKFLNRAENGDADAMMFATADVSTEARQHLADQLLQAANDYLDTTDNPSFDFVRLIEDPKDLADIQPSDNALIISSLPQGLLFASNDFHAHPTDYSRRLLEKAYENPAKSYLNSKSGEQAPVLEKTLLNLLSNSNGRILVSMIPQRCCGSSTHWNSVVANELTLKGSTQLDRQLGADFEAVNDIDQVMYDGVPIRGLEKVASVIRTLGSDEVAGDVHSYVASLDGSKQKEVLETLGINSDPEEFLRVNQADLYRAIGQKGIDVNVAVKATQDHIKSLPEQTQKKLLVEHGVLTEQESLAGLNDRQVDAAIDRSIRSLRPHERKPLFRDLGVASDPQHDLNKAIYEETMGPDVVVDAVQGYIKSLPRKEQRKLLKALAIDADTGNRFRMDEAKMDAVIKDYVERYQPYNQKQLLRKLGITVDWVERVNAKPKETVQLMGDILIPDVTLGRGSSVAAQIEPTLTALGLADKQLQEGITIGDVRALIGENNDLDAFAFSQLLELIKADGEMANTVKSALKDYKAELGDQGVDFLDNLGLTLRDVDINHGTEYGMNSDQLRSWLNGLDSSQRVDVLKAVHSVDDSVHGENLGLRGVYGPAAYVRKMSLEFPGVFRSIGEITGNKEGVSVQLGPESWDVSSKKFQGLLHFLSETGMPILFHNDWGVPGQHNTTGRLTGKISGYEYFDDMLDVLENFPDAKIVFAHTGIGRFHRPDISLQYTKGDIVIKESDSHGHDHDHGHGHAHELGTLNENGDPVRINLGESDVTVEYAKGDITIRDLDGNIVKSLDKNSVEKLKESHEPLEVELSETKVSVDYMTKDIVVKGMDGKPIKDQDGNELVLKNHLAPVHIHKLYELFDRLPWARADLSWTDVAQAVTQTPEIRDHLAHFMYHNQDRLIAGTDTVKPASRAHYMQYLKQISPLIGKLALADTFSGNRVKGNEASFKFLVQNFNDVIDPGRQSIISWTEQTLASEAGIDLLALRKEHNQEMAQVSQLQSMIRNGGKSPDGVASLIGRTEPDSSPRAILKHYTAELDVLDQLSKRDSRLIADIVDKGYAIIAENAEARLNAWANEQLADGNLTETRVNQTKDRYLSFIRIREERALKAEPAEIGTAEKIKKMWRREDEISSHHDRIVAEQQLSFAKWTKELYENEAQGDINKLRESSGYTDQYALVEEGFVNKHAESDSAGKQVDHKGEAARVGEKTSGGTDQVDPKLRREIIRDTVAAMGTGIAGMVGLHLSGVTVPADVNAGAFLARGVSGKLKSELNQRWTEVYEGVTELNIAPDSQKKYSMHERLDKLVDFLVKHQNEFKVDPTQVYAAERLIRQFEVDFNTIIKNNAGDHRNLNDNLKTNLVAEVGRLQATLDRVLGFGFASMSPTDSRTKLGKALNATAVGTLGVNVFNSAQWGGGKLKDLNRAVNRMLIEAGLDPNKMLEGGLEFNDIVSGANGASDVAFNTAFGVANTGALWLGLRRLIASTKGVGTDTRSMQKLERGIFKTYTAATAAWVSKDGTAMMESIMANGALSAESMVLATKLGLDAVFLKKLYNASKDASIPTQGGRGLTPKIRNKTAGAVGAVLATRMALEILANQPEFEEEANELISSLEENMKTVVSDFLSLSESGDEGDFFTTTPVSRTTNS